GGRGRGGEGGEEGGGALGGGAAGGGLPPPPPRKGGGGGGPPRRAPPPGPGPPPPAAPAAVDPPLVPPGTRVSSHGLRVGPYAEFSVLLPIANSSQFVLPTRIAPAARSLVTTVASYGGRKSFKIREPHVVGQWRVQLL